MADAFIDTSFVVALVNKRDQFHSDALRLAAEYEKRPLVTTDAVLLEIGNALAKNFKPESIQIIEHFLTSGEIQIINLNESLFLQALEFYRSRPDKAWGAG